MSGGPQAGGTTGGRIGDLLLSLGLITQEDLDRALESQRQTGSRLGTILVADGTIDRRDLYRALARQWNHDFIDLSTSTVEDDLLEGLEPQHLLDEGWVPVRRDEDGFVLVATSDEPSPELASRIAAEIGEPVRLTITSDWDIDETLQRHFKGVLVDQAALGLWRRSVAQSARSVLLPWQKVLGAITLAVLIVVTVFFPVQTLITASMVIGLGFLVSVGFKFIVCMRGARKERLEPVTAEDVAALGDRDLPSYSVLVPVFREAEVVAGLVDNLSRLDYPPERLEVLLLLEEGDDETIEAATASGLPATIRPIIIPQGQPKTKPKACNVGLFFARGEFIVIYDAEDKPEPDQLKKAVIAFRRSTANTVCIQAQLNYWNVYDNVLTRMFTVEYSYWFDYMLPGLDDARLPIPLGGTSNHFRARDLRILGGWDPFNVTEDADLGIRAACMGYRVGLINSTTYEEANRAMGNWIRQRSRWIKGYLQTLLVHLRQPRRLIRTAGLRQTTAFILLIGGTPASFLLSVPLYAIFFASLFLPTDAMGRLFPGWVLLVSWLNLLVGNALMIYVAMMGAFRRRNYRLVKWALFNPVYWLMHATAAYKATWQLITKPHYWEKTAHGLSTPASGHAQPAGADSHG